MKKLIYSSALSLLLAGSLQAQGVGTLNTDFDVDGVWSHDMGGGSDYVRAVQVQDDGKILVAGYGSYNGNTSSMIARLNPDGSFDTSFSFDGMLITDAGQGETDQVFGMTLTDGGKIVCAGAAYNGTDYDVLIFRLNSDGSFDDSFATNGIGTYDFSLGGDDRAYDVAVQSDGKIVVAGFSSDGMQSDCLLGRIHADGIYDYSFNSDGKLIMDVGAGRSDYLNAVEIKPNGSIVAVGQMAQATDLDAIVLMVTSAGDPDVSFSGNGVWEYDYGTDTDDYLYDVKIQNDGKIVVCGAADNGYDMDGLVSRLHDDGTLDYSFHGDGILELNLSPGNTDYSRALALQADGKIIVGGYSYDTIYKSTVVRLKPDGLTDYSFNGTGVSMVNPGGSFLTRGMAMAPNGDIFLAGYMSLDFGVISLNGETVTATEDALLTANQLQVYPNPFAETLFIRIQQNDASGWQLLDMTGRRVAGGQLNTQHADISLDLSEQVRDLPAGAYLLHLTGGSRTVSSKIIRR